MLEKELPCEKMSPPETYISGGDRIRKSLRGRLLPFGKLGIAAGYVAN